MNYGKWVAASLCVALLALSVSSTQAATVTGGVWISQWTEGQTKDAAVDNLKTAIADGVDGGYGAPVWQLTETAVGGEYKGTFALYVNLNEGLSAWTNLLNMQSQIITFGTTGDVTWSVGWNSYSSTNHSEGIWGDGTFLFAGVGTGLQDHQTDFFANSGNAHQLTIGGENGAQPLGATNNAGRIAGSKWLLGVFDLTISGVSDVSEVVFSVATAGNGYIQGSSGVMTPPENLVFNTPTLYTGANPFNGTDSLTVPTTYVFAATAPVPPVVPEPGTYAMLCGLGLIGAAWYRRNRKKA